MKPIAHLASGGQLPGRRENAASTLGWAVVVLLFCVLWGVGESPCWGEDKPNTKLLFLVARTSILDPFFERSVVLMVPLQGEPLIVGLVVNKPTLLPLLKIFPKSPALKSRSENAYLGGPVDMAAPALAFHARKPPKQALLLYDDVYLSFDPKFITRLIQDPKETGELRLFMGRAQWAPQQLQGEALRGSWYSLRAEGEVIFDRDTEHLWKRLEERAEAPKSVQELLPQAPQTLGYKSAPTFLTALPPGRGALLLRLE
jgi:putative transcriptional regulator